MEIRIEKASGDKKFCAIVEGSRVCFGNSAMEDYTIHKDEKRKKNYVSRMGGDFTGPNGLDGYPSTTTDRARKQDWTITGIKTAGFWSRWLLWSLQTLDDSANLIEKQFGVRIVQRPWSSTLYEGKIRPDGITLYEFDDKYAVIIDSLSDTVSLYSTKREDDLTIEREALTSPRAMNMMRLRQQNRMNDVIRNGFDITYEMRTYGLKIREFSYSRVEIFEPDDETLSLLIYRMGGRYTYIDGNGIIEFETEEEIKSYSMLNEEPIAVSDNYIYFINHGFMIERKYITDMRYIMTMLERHSDKVFAMYEWITYNPMGDK